MHKYDCANCEFRFKCYTSKSRPMVVDVNWNVSLTCGLCKNASFSHKFSGYVDWYSSYKIGYCKVKKCVVHQHSTSCDDFVVRKKGAADLKTIKQELVDALSKLHSKTKLPKFCIKEQPEVDDSAG